MMKFTLSVEFPGLPVCWMKKCSEIKIKEERLSKQMTGELRMSCIWKYCLKPPLQWERTIVWSTPTQRHTMAALNLNAKENETGRAQAFIQIQHFRRSFHWEAVCRKHMSTESHLKSWCDCWWRWLYQTGCRETVSCTTTMSVCNFYSEEDKNTQLEFMNSTYNANSHIMPLNWGPQVSLTAFDTSQCVRCICCWVQWQLYKRPLTCAAWFTGSGLM